jgi:hypothetical protein
MNEFLTKEEKERIKLRVEKALDNLRTKYENINLAEKTHEQRKRDLDEYTRIRGL